MRAAKHEYPFSFTFPEQFNYNFLNFRTNAAYGQARMVGPGPLPPHLDHEDSFAGISIYYPLTARVPRTFVDCRYSEMDPLAIDLIMATSVIEQPYLTISETLLIRRLLTSLLSRGR
jgi:hypothetical protein